MGAAVNTQSIEELLDKVGLNITALLSHQSKASSKAVLTDEGIPLGLKPAFEWVKSHGLCLSTDLIGNITAVNLALLNRTGYTEKELIGQNPRILKAPNQPDSVYEQLWQTITEGRTWQGLVHNVTKSGERFALALTIVPELNREGQTVGYHSLGVDVTAVIADSLKIETLKSRLAELERQAEQAEVLNVRIDVLQKQLAQAQEREALLTQQAIQHANEQNALKTELETLRHAPKVQTEALEAALAEVTERERHLALQLVQKNTENAKLLQEIEALRQYKGQADSVKQLSEALQTAKIEIERVKSEAEFAVRQSIKLNQALEAAEQEKKALSEANLLLRKNEQQLEKKLEARTLELMLETEKYERLLQQNLAQQHPQTNPTVNFTALPPDFSQTFDMHLTFGNFDALTALVESLTDPMFEPFKQQVLKSLDLLDHHRLEQLATQIRPAQS